jgi:predicted RNA-binding protein associated with RNAse of E/G family
MLLYNYQKENKKSLIPSRQKEYFMNNESNYTYEDMVILSRSAEEQEMTITEMRGDGFIEVYISNNIRVTQFRKLVKNNPKDYIITRIPRDTDGNPTGYFITFPSNLISFRNPCVLSEEQKQARSDRMKKMRQEQSL